MENTGLMENLYTNCRHHCHPITLLLRGRVDGECHCGCEECTCEKCQETRKKAEEMMNRRTLRFERLECGHIVGGYMTLRTCNLSTTLYYEYNMEGVGNVHQ